MKKFYTIKELVDMGYPRQWLYQLAHSQHFVEAGGRRLTGKRATILFDEEKLAKYFELTTIENL